MRSEITEQDFPTKYDFFIFRGFFVLKITITVLCMVKAFIRQEDNTWNNKK